jgi:hypothetical protein
MTVIRRNCVDLRDDAGALVVRVLQHQFRSRHVGLRFCDTIRFHDLGNAFLERCHFGFWIGCQTGRGRSHV